MPSQTSTHLISPSAACAAPLSRPAGQDLGAHFLKPAMVSSAVPNGGPLYRNGIASHFNALTYTAKHCSSLKGRLPQRNGVISAVPLPNGHPKSPPLPRARETVEQTPPQSAPSPKTEAQHSGQSGSVTSHPHQDRLVCPGIAATYVSSVMDGRSGQVSSRLQELEARLQALQRRLRERQTVLVEEHATELVSAVEEGRLCIKKETPPLVSSDGGMESCGESPVLRWRRCCSGGSMESYSSGSVVEAMECDLPIQVDGATDSLTPDRAPDLIWPSSTEDQSLTKCSSMSDVSSLRHNSTDSSVFNAVEASSITSSPSVCVGEDQLREHSVATCISQQLECLQSLLDGELTECSSDEEEGALRERSRTQEALQQWEHARSSLGARWAWLEHRIAALSKQICLLDNLLHKRPKRESFISASPEPLTCVCALRDGALGGTGSLLAASAIGRSRVGNNGIGSHLPCTHFPQLLLPEGMLNTKLQVKDLLMSSPLARGFSVVLDEAGSSSARSRPLERRPRRKLVRLRKERGRKVLDSCSTLGDSLHSTLSLPGDVPSRVWLDGAFQQICAEHSYAAFPMSKRRKPDFSLVKGRATPLPLDGKLAVLKKSGTPLHLTTSDSLPVSPHTPFPSTPTLTPQPPRRKKLLPSTPSFDIDNIVIPYSIAASTRLEKLEYKEILTPSWREVDAVDKCEEEEEEEEEDVSDQHFLQRHEECELREKKRFLNFISGGQRKRHRPPSLASTPDGSLDSPGQERQRRPLLSPASVEEGPPRLLLAWLPRKFPLGEADMDALSNPVPPPAIKPPLPSSTSPSPLPLSTRSCTPSDLRSQLHTPTPPLSTSSAHTPLSTPPSTPFSESPLLSPAEWTVLSYQQPTPFRAALESEDSRIVLKLSKKS